MFRSGVCNSTGQQTSIVLRICLLLQRGVDLQCLPLHGDTNHTFTLETLTLHCPCCADDPSRMYISSERLYVFTEYAVCIMCDPTCVTTGQQQVFFLCYCVLVPGGSKRWKVIVQGLGEGTQDLWRSQLLYYNTVCAIKSTDTSY